VGKYIFEEVNNIEEWGSFIQTSKEYTIFSNPLYIQNFGGKYKLYFIKKGNQVKAGVYVILEDDNNLKVDDLVIYFGILFEYNQFQKTTKSLLERFEITEFIIEYLDKMYNKIDIVLSPEIIDIRPFLWYNYHSNNLYDKFKVDIKYTSYIDISSLKEFKNEENTILFRNLETLRQRNIREARKKEAYTIIENKSDLFIKYYKELMINQNSIPTEEKLKNMKNIIDILIKNNMAKMYISKNKDGVIQYITIFAWDRYRAYYLFGAPNPDAKERYKGTISFWDAFIDLAKQGIKIVDMEGVNSPKRGWFKLSFGGELKTYYRVTKEKK